MTVVAVVNIGSCPSPTLTSAMPLWIRGAVADLECNSAVRVEVQTVFSLVVE